MLKTKTVRIDERVFTVRELPMRVVRDLLNNEQGDQPMLERARALLQLACPELTAEILWEMYPSEIEELWQAFEEVNAAFLGVVRTLGLDRIVIETVRGSLLNSTRPSVSLSAPATATWSGTMASASS